MSWNESTFKERIQSSTDIKELESELMTMYRILSNPSIPLVIKSIRGMHEKCAIIIERLEELGVEKPLL